MAKKKGKTSKSKSSLDTSASADSIKSSEPQVDVEDDGKAQANPNTEPVPEQEQQTEQPKSEQQQEQQQDAVDAKVQSANNEEQQQHQPQEQEQQDAPALGDRDRQASIESTDDQAVQDDTHHAVVVQAKQTEIRRRLQSHKNLMDAQNDPSAEIKSNTDEIAMEADLEKIETESKATTYSQQPSHQQESQPQQSKDKKRLIFIDPQPDMNGRYELPIDGDKDLVKEGPMQRLDRNQRWLDRYCFLFSDFLLVAQPAPVSKPDEESKYRILNKIDMKEASIDVTDVNQLNSFSVFSSTKRLVLRTQNQTQKNEWISVLHLVMDSIKDRTAPKNADPEIARIQTYLKTPYSINLLENPARTFVKEGEVHKKSIPLNDKRQLYLFNDIIIVGKKSLLATSKKGSIEVRQVFELKDTKVAASTSNKTSFVISLDKSIEFNAQSAQDATDWVEAIQGQIDQLNGVNPKLLLEENDGANVNEHRVFVNNVLDLAVARIAKYFKKPPADLLTGKKSLILNCPVEVSDGIRAPASRYAFLITDRLLLAKSHNNEDVAKPPYDVDMQFNLDRLNVDGNDKTSAHSFSVSDEKRTAVFHCENSRQKADWLEKLGEAIYQHEKASAAADMRNISFTPSASLQNVLKQLKKPYPQEMVVPNRYLIKEGTLRRRDKYQTHVDRYCFLFNDVMVVTQVASFSNQKEYEVKQIIRLEEAFITPQQDGDNPNSFSVLYRNRDYVFIASSLTAREEWLKYLELVVIPIKRKNESYNAIRAPTVADRVMDSGKKMDAARGKTAVSLAWETKELSAEMSHVMKLIAPPHNKLVYAPGRESIVFGPLTTPAGFMGSQKTFAFLFNDVLLLAIADGQQFKAPYHITNVLGTNNFTVEPEGHVHPDSFRIVSDQMNFILQAASPLIKRKWLAALRNVQEKRKYFHEVVLSSVQKPSHEPANFDASANVTPSTSIDDLAHSKPVANGSLRAALAEDDIHTSGMNGAANKGSQPVEEEYEADRVAALKLQKELQERLYKKPQQEEHKEELKANGVHDD